MSKLSIQQCDQGWEVTILADNGKKYCIGNPIGKPVFSTAREAWEYAKELSVRVSLEQDAWDRGWTDDPQNITEK